MSSALSAVPVDRRRRAGIALLALAALFVAVGIVGVSSSAPGVVVVFAALVLAAGVLAGLAAWGTLHSITLDGKQSRLDAAIAAAIAEHDATCNCGHQHGPAEEPAPAASCGTSDCAHDCASCVLSRR